MSEEEAIAQVCPIIVLLNLSMNLTAFQLQIVALLFAGSETTVNLISEVLYELALNPKVQHHLCEELNAVKSIDGGGSQLAYDRLMSAEHTPYLDAVLREGLRLKAVLMDISRCVRDVLLRIIRPVLTMT
jgi:cytochrome P450